MGVSDSVDTSHDSTAIPWKGLFIGAAVCKFCAESYLSYRQYKVLQRTTIPSELANEVDQPTYDQSQAYGRAKIIHSSIKGLWTVIKNALIIYYDLYTLLWAASGMWMECLLPSSLHGEVVHSLIFACAYHVIEAILEIPLSYHQNFVLEAKFGFNKQTVSLWVGDVLRDLCLSTVLGMPVWAAAIKIIQITGQAFIWWLWLFSVIVQMATLTIYPLLIIPIFNKLTPLKAGLLKDRMGALAKRLRFPLGDVQVIDGSKRSAHSNAFLAGLPWNKTIILYDTLIAGHDVPEVEAVLAHELGHWQNNDMLRVTGISALYLFYTFAVFAVLLGNETLSRALGFGRQIPVAAGYVTLKTIASPVDSFIQLLVHILMRRMEFKADAFSQKLGYGAELTASLIRLHVHNLVAMEADWAYSAYHHSHPILTERLKAIGWTHPPAPTVLKGPKAD